MQVYQTLARTRDGNGDVPGGKWKTLRDGGKIRDSVPCFILGICFVQLLINVSYSVIAHVFSCV